METRKNAIDIFNAAVKAVAPSTLLPNHLQWQPPYLIIGNNRIEIDKLGKIFIIGAGKASALMAQTAESILGDAITAGVVVTKYGHALPLSKIELFEAGHPVPDWNSIVAARAILKLVSGLSSSDIVIFLLSGGASSLLVDYPKDVDFAVIQALNETLLRCGANIYETNTVRKHLSNIKGGQLAKHVFPAILYSLILSDVPGDEMDVIGSGPTVPDKTTFDDAWDVLIKYNIADVIDPTIRRYFRDGVEGKIPDTPKTGEPYFARTTNLIIGSNRIALEAAAVKAQELGYTEYVASDPLHGEASRLGKMLAGEAIDFSGVRPGCLLYGGESTVTVGGKGKGGRNMELALSAGVEILGHPGITILSAGTDGSDGPTDAAGAVVDASIMKEAMEKNLNPAVYLKNNDSYNFFAPVGALIKTGATQTNVMDIMLALIQ